MLPCTILYSKNTCTTLLKFVLSVPRKCYTKNDFAKHFAEDQTTLLGNQKWLTEFASNVSANWFPFQHFCCNSGQAWASWLTQQSLNSRFGLFPIFNFLHKQWSYQENRSHTIFQENISWHVHIKPVINKLTADWTGVYSICAVTASN